MTPHFGTEILNEDGKVTKEFHYSEKKHIVSEKTSETMRILLESVVSEGSGKNAYVEGYRIGARRRPPRHYREVRTSTYLLLWDLPRQMIRRSWECV